MWRRWRYQWTKSSERNKWNYSPRNWIIFNEIKDTSKININRISNQNYDIHKFIYFTINPTSFQISCPNQIRIVNYPWVSLQLLGHPTCKSPRAWNILNLIKDYWSINISVDAQIRIISLTPILALFQNVPELFSSSSGFFFFSLRFISRLMSTVSPFSFTFAEIAPLECPKKYN